MRYTEIKRALIEAEIIDEVSMSPSSLEKFANSPEAEGMLLGIEFELCVPNANIDSEPEWEYDYNQNESAYDIDDIVNFFRNDDFSNMGRSDADRARAEMFDEYLEWSYSAANQYIDDNVDDLDKLIRSRLEDEVSRDDASDEAHQRWIEANPDKDATSEEAGQEIRDITLQMIEDRVDELMGDTDSNEYQYAYDEARQEMEDDFRNGGDGDQAAWLSDIGVNDMQDAERQWNYSWPHMIDNNEGNGGDADVDQIADDFYGATGYEARGYNNYHAASRSDQQAQGYFIIEPDGSIDADQGDAGLEFISPAMPLKDGLVMLKKVKQWAKLAGCYTNKSTGLHMNISVPNMTTDNLDYVKLALFLGDEYVLNEFGRAYNTYAKSAMAIVREKIQQNPENATALLAKMKEHLGAAASKLVHSGVTQKYTSINTKGNYVEFRGPGGNYLDEDLPKLLNTALRLAQSLRIATDESAYKQEYAKKLYKLISPEGEWTDPNNSVALFSRYALGQINKSELVNNVRQAQVARKEKKGDEQQYWVLNKDGSGGKQMVFATSSTEAIIKGGKQMGMSREASISTLKSEPFVDINKDNVIIPDSLPNWWQNTLKNLKDETLQNVQDIRSMAADREQGLNPRDTQLDSSQQPIVLNIIDNELRRRQDNTPPASVPLSWIDWLADTLPSVTVDTINSVRERIVNGGDNLDADASGWIVKQIDNELRSRQDQGVVDGNETRWEVVIARGPFNGRDAVYVDADSPRQAKLKAQGLIWRSQSIDVAIEDLEAVATNDEAGRPEVSWNIINGLGEPAGTVNARSSDEALRIYGGTNNVDTRYYRATSAETTPSAGTYTSFADAQAAADRMNAGTAPTTSRAVFDSLANVWQDWLQDIGSKSSSDLQRVIDNMSSGANAHYTNLDTDQKDFIFNTVNQELRRRGAANGTAWTSILDGLPEAWKSWIERIADHHELELRQAADHIANDNQGSLYRDLSVGQKEFINGHINRELTRRGTTASSMDTMAAAASRAENEVYASLPQAHRNFLDTMENSSDMGLINVLRNVGGSDQLNDQQIAYFRVAIKHELRHRGIDPNDESTVPNYEIYAPASGVVVHQFHADSETDANRKFSEFEQNYESDSDFHHEYRRIGPAAANVPQSSPAGRNNDTTGDYEVYNPETMAIVSTIRGGTEIYADNKARELERDLGLAADSLRIRRADSRDINESIKQLRKLAGLK
jgi:hypothetical protein